MTHLVANFPDKNSFFEALKAMFKNNVEYLEIQIPFTHPLADGPTIYEANQKALPNFDSIETTFTEVSKIKKEFPGCQTKLILMSYTTPVLHFGIKKNFPTNIETRNGVQSYPAGIGAESCSSLKLLVEKMKEYNFFGFIIPDLTFGTSEQIELSKLCKENNLEFIPVISPLTSKIRIKKIKPFLSQNQTIYATARTGKTGSQTNLEGKEVTKYLEFLKENFADFKLSLGFGIKEKSQVQFLREKGITPVIGSQIVRIIEKADLENLNVFDEINKFLKQVN